MNAFQDVYLLTIKDLDVSLANVLARMSAIRSSMINGAYTQPVMLARRITAARLHPRMNS